MRKKHVRSDLTVFLEIESPNVPWVPQFCTQNVGAISQESSF